jgi:hypothetical protein
MSDAKLEEYLDAVVETFGEGREEIETALRLISENMAKGIDPVPSQLLAVRRYLRIGGKKLVANWSWTESEAKTKSTVEPTKTLYEQAHKVRATFAQQNPGYTLGISPIRSLERQVRKWSKNSTVHSASTKLLEVAIAELAKADYPSPPTGSAVVRFAAKLKHMSVSPEPTNAAPGTSDHGRGVAVDFVVLKGSKVLADAKSSHVGKIWKGEGWDAKLAAACEGTKLQGPLPHPLEPWHWWL